MPQWLLALLQNPWVTLVSGAVIAAIPMALGWQRTKIAKDKAESDTNELRVKQRDDLYKGEKELRAQDKERAERLEGKLREELAALKAQYEEAKQRAESSEGLERKLATAEANYARLDAALHRMATELSERLHNEQRDVLPDRPRSVKPPPAQADADASSPSPSPSEELLPWIDEAEWTQIMHDARYQEAMADWHAEEEDKARAAQEAYEASGAAAEDAEEDFRWRQARAAEADAEQQAHDDEQARSEPDEEGEPEKK